MSTVTISAGLPSRAGSPAPLTRPTRAQATRPRPTRPRAAPPGSASRATGPLRLTRRGRLVATFVLLMALLAGGVVLAGGLASAGTEPGAAATAQRVTVAPGDTLWSIAEREAPDADPRDTVADILELNHLTSSAVEAGSVLLLP